MITTRIALSIFSILAAFAMMAGATYAFFTDTDQSSNNTIRTGTLEIDVEQENESDLQNVITNLAPGEQGDVEFEVHNTGSLPVYIRGFATGQWGPGVDTPDNSLMRVVKVEYVDGGQWEELTSDPNGIDGYVYFGSDQANPNVNNLFEISETQNQRFKLTVELDPETTDEKYEGRAYTANVHIEARQTTQGANWPGEE